MVVVPAAYNPLLLKEDLEHFGFKPCSDAEYKPTQGSYYIGRSGKLNLIVVPNYNTFNIWKRCTIAATALGLVNKEDRVKLFNTMLNADV